MNPEKCLSLNAVQNIFAQVLHDFISHFTPLSAGMEMLTSLQDPAWHVIQESKNQMYAQINLIRFLFGPGMGTNKEAQNLTKQYMEHTNISIDGSIGCYPKITAGLALWMSKQVYGSTSRLYIDNKGLSIQSEYVRQDAAEDAALLTGQCIHSPRIGYALYLFHLTQMEKINLSVHRNPTHLSVQWE